MEREELDVVRTDQDRRRKDLTPERLVEHDGTIASDRSHTWMAGGTRRHDRTVRSRRIATRFTGIFLMDSIELG
jgi:hypothetical protein